MWKEEIAKQRIKELIDSAPKIKSIRYQEDYLPGFYKMLEGDKSRSIKILHELPENTAVYVNTVQIYVNVSNLDNILFQDGEETTESHQQLLKFLHSYCYAFDKLISDSDAHRVDFHNARLHAAVIEEAGEAGKQKSILKAIKIAEEIAELSNKVAREISGLGYDLEFSIGVDFGECVAINSGKKPESEPMFLGDAANIAAKLADNKQPGLYLSDNVIEILEISRPIEEIGKPYLLNRDSQHIRELYNKFYEQSLDEISSDRVSKTFNELRNDINSGKVVIPDSPDFKFHYHQPPLSSIEYDKLMPSNSIRMEMCTIFADVDGYTKYISDCITKRDITNAITALHVIRKELNNVLKLDFEGKKVRFIGDCIQGVVADGDTNNIDDKRTVESSLKCSAAMRSSFTLCQEMLDGTENLGLAIGIEFGETPVTRLGIRGDKGVRVASSKASIDSEQCQKQCSGNQTAIGDNAFKISSPEVKRFFGFGKVVDGFDYTDTGMLFRETKSADARIVNDDEPFRAHSEPCE